MTAIAATGARRLRVPRGPAAGPADLPAGENRKRRTPVEDNNTEIGRPLFLFNGCPHCGNALQVMEDRTGNYLKCTSCSRVQGQTQPFTERAERPAAAAA